MRPHFGFWFDPRFTTSDPMKAFAGGFYSIAFKLLKAWSHAYTDCIALHLTSAKPRRKDIAMTDTTSEPPELFVLDISLIPCCRRVPQELAVYADAFDA